MLFSLCSLPREMHCVPSSVPQLQILRVTCGRVSFSQKKKKTIQSNVKQKQQNKTKQKKNPQRDKRETLVVTCRKASNISCKKKKWFVFKFTCKSLQDIDWYSAI